MAIQTDVTMAPLHPAAVRLPRWGEGVIFAVRRVVNEGDSAGMLGCRDLALAALDAGLLEEFIEGCLLAGTDIVSLDEARHRLSQGAGAPHFVSFTFDGATRGLLNGALPVLKKHGLPFTVFVSPVQHDEMQLPWWLMLEALVLHTPRLSIAVRGQTFRAACHTPEEKAETLDNLVPLLMVHPEPAVRRAILAVCEADGIDLDAIAAETLMNWDEVRALAAEPLVTIGQLASECHGAGLSAYDSVHESLRRDRVRLGETLNKGPRHIGFSAGWTGLVEERDLEIVAGLGFSSAALPEGGLAIAGGVARCAVLPRMCISNAPHVLLEAQGLAGTGIVPKSSRSSQAAA